MKRFLACLALCASLSASAQVVYPYNPDANGDSAITSSDLLDFLPVFATTFTPQVITIDSVPLDQWLVDLNSVINDLQAHLNAQDATIDSLQNAAMTRDSVADIAVGVAWRGELAGADLSDADLSDADLSGANLSGADLSSANLWGADLSGANLTGANLDDANLFDANLSAADLTAAYLDDANLVAAVLSDADLSGANLSGANLVAAVLSDANLTGANLSGADLSSANLTGTNLSGATLFQLDLSEVDLSGAILSGASMTLLFGCPSLLPTGYTCEPDPDWGEPGLYRIVPE